MTIFHCNAAEFNLSSVVATRIVLAKQWRGFVDEIESTTRDETAPTGCHASALILFDCGQV
jgi:hypothetical protein